MHRHSMLYQSYRLSRSAVLGSFPRSYTYQSLPQCKRSRALALRLQPVALKLQVKKCGRKILTNNIAQCLQSWAIKQFLRTLKSPGTQNPPGMQLVQKDLRYNAADIAWHRLTTQGKSVAVQPTVLWPCSIRRPLKPAGSCYIHAEEKN